MSTSQAINKPNRRSKYTLNDAMNALFQELDKGIDDLEQGRVVSADELFAELDEMDQKGIL